MIAAVLVEKDPLDDWIYPFDLSDFGVIREGDTLASATVTCPTTGLTIGLADISGVYVQFQIAGGTAGTTYRLTILATTTSGAKLPVRVNVDVKVPKGFS